jgi:hypothetical protein
MAAIAGLGYLLLTSCNDEINPVGTGILPDEDHITVYADTFPMMASTVQYDSLYARSHSGFLGEFYDPLYGRLKSDYVCQFYCKDGFRFAHTPDNGLIDSISLVLVYYEWQGDPAIPMQVSIYPVTEQLPKNYYTNVDPTPFCDRNPILSQAYAAQSGILVDTADTESGRMQYFRLPLEWGQNIYNETVNNPSSFDSQESFNRFLPGLYITTDYGSGNMLYISSTQLLINYHYTETASTGEDSVITAWEIFNVSKDIIQLNRFESTYTEPLLADTDYTYLKTPAGIFTRIVVPAAEISRVIEKRIINYVSLNLRYMPQEKWEYALTPPSYMLLIPEDSIHTFFENRNIENNITSYLSDYSSSSSPAGYNEAGRVYPFPNIANLLNYHIAYNPDEDLRLLAVPVSRNIATSSSYYSGSTFYTTSLSHYLAPSGLKIRKDGNNMKVVIISSLLNN